VDEFTTHPISLVGIELKD